MTVYETGFQGLLVIEPEVFRDDRGLFLESFQENRYRELGIDENFSQDNFSRSSYGVIRGLHFQKTKPQGKLVFCLNGRVLDVVVDLRPESKSLGRVFSVVLDSEKLNQLWIPAGFAHGFSVLSNTADFFYKCTHNYCPEDEGGILWCDNDLAIDWLVSNPSVSEKDQKLPSLREVIS